MEQADFTGMSSFHKAAANGHMAFLQVLIEKGCNVNKQDTNGLSALHHASRNGHLETLKWLVDEQGADVTVTSKKDRTAHALTRLSGSATYVRQQEILSYLKAKENGESPWEKVKVVKTANKAVS